MNEPMVKLAGLYEKTSQKGNKYFIGRLNGARLLMFANTEKQTDTDPDWFLYVQERNEQPSGKEESRSPQPPAAGDYGGLAGGDYPRRGRAA